MIDASSSARRGSGLMSSSVRNSCSLAWTYPEVRSPPIDTPMAPGAQPFPWAFHTACRMHLRTPSSERSARPRFGSSDGNEYCAFMFSQPPPFRISLTSISSSFSHCSKWMTGVPGPRLLPEFSPVTESTELGRSLPRRVASAIASRICFFSSIWLTPTGVLTSKVGMPVSWQMAPSSPAARSTFWAMIASAWDDCVPGVSCDRAARIAARTSGGRSVEVRTMRVVRLSRKLAGIPPV